MEKYAIIRKKLNKSGKSYVFRFKVEECELYDLQDGDIFEVALKKLSKEID